LVCDIPAGDGKIANLFLQCSEVERIPGISVQVLWSLLSEGLFRDSFRDLLSGIYALCSLRDSTPTLNRQSCKIEEENLVQCKKEAATKSGPQYKKIIDFAGYF
jgi:hypothetical protein